MLLRSSNAYAYGFSRLRCTQFSTPRLSLRKFPFAISQIAQWLQVWLAIEMCHDRVIRSMRASPGGCGL